MGRQYGAPKENPGDTPGSNRYSDQRKDPAPKPEQPDPSPSADLVVKFHRNAPVDSRTEDIHHTLGPGPSQASPGDHSHDGGDSPLLLEGYTLVGSKANPTTVLPSIIAALARLGAKDSTT